MKSEINGTFFSLTKTILVIIFFAGTLLCHAAPSASDNALFNKSVSDFKRHNYEAVLRSLNQLMEKYPQSGYMEKSLIMEADCFLRLQKPGNTIKILDYFFKKYRSSLFTANAKYLYGTALIYNGYYDEGAKLLCKVVDKSSDPILDSLSLIGINLYLSLKVEPDDIADLEKSFYSNTVLLSQFIYSRGVKYFEAGNFAEAYDAFEMFLNKFGSDPKAEKAEEYLNISKSKTDKMLRVALLLPMNGDYKQTSLSVLNASMLAFGQYNASHEKKIYWKTINTKGDPVNAVRDVQVIMQEGKIQTIIGPLLSQEVIAAGALINNNPLTLITPTATGENITSVSSSVYQIPLTPKALSAKIAGYAVDVLKINEFIVIAPISEYGRIMTDGFKDAVESLGAACTITLYYPEGETNFKRFFQEIRKRKLTEMSDKGLTGADIISWQDTLSKDDSTQTPAEDDTTIVYVGGIYMPCNQEDVVPIASQADHYLVKGQLFGTSSWYSQQLMQKQNSKILDGAFICVDFISEANTSGWTEFSKNYKTRYNTDPDKVAGQAYDAATLICRTYDNLSNNPSAGDFKSKLGEVRNFQGVSGKISFNPNTHINEEGIILRILKGTFIRVY